MADLDAPTKTITAEMVKKAKWRSEFFLDLGDGGYRNQYTCVEFPRLTHAKWAEKGSGPHHQAFWVDGREVVGSQAMAIALNKSKAQATDESSDG